MSKTRLIEAVKTLDLKETKRILEAKPELLKVWNDQGRNLLHLACSAECKKLGKPESAGTRMVKYLLDSGLDIEEAGGAGPDLCTPIWFATAKGRNASVVKLLLKRGARSNGLYAAGWWEDIHILKLLIDGGAEGRCRRRNALPRLLGLEEVQGREGPRARGRRRQRAGQARPYRAAYRHRERV